MTDEASILRSLQSARAASQQAERRLAQFKVGVAADDPDHPELWTDAQRSAYLAASAEAHARAKTLHALQRLWKAKRRRTA